MEEQLYDLETRVSEVLGVEEQQAKEIINEDPDTEEMEKMRIDAINEIGAPLDPDVRSNLSEGLDALEENTDEWHLFDDIFYQQTLEILDGYQMRGKSPNVVAASAAYINAHLTHQKVGQEKVGEAFDVSQVAIRSAYRDIVDRNDIG